MDKTANVEGGTESFGKALDVLLTYNEDVLSRHKHIE
jgi:hypothetical protein